MVFTKIMKTNTHLTCLGKTFSLGAEDFLLRITTQITLASAHIINKSLIKDINANDYCGTNLVQVNLILDAVTRSKSCFYFKKYMIAIQKNNSGGLTFTIYL